MSKRVLKSSKDDTSSKKIKVSDSITEEYPGLPSGFPIERTRTLTKNNNMNQLTGDCVVYWMFRDQRVEDNHSIQYAQSIAQSKNVPLKIVFNLLPNFLNATIRQYGFMLKGLQEIEQSFRDLNIPFHLLMGDPVDNIFQFLCDQNAMLLVSDFSPMRVPIAWGNTLAQRMDNYSSKKIPYVQIDAHNIVPCWVASPKLEYSARTFRGKITPLIPKYLHPIPPPSPNPPGSLTGCEPVDWVKALASLQINRDVTEVTWLTPGPKAAHEVMMEFIQNKLKDYGDKRNDPNLSCSSNLSPYFHFGQISPLKVILTLKQMKKQGSSVDAFIEEMVVRRELTDNYCFYNPYYDTLQGCYDWAKETLETHKKDVRAVVYSQEQLEYARTHDDLWNAAQLQMTKEGKMHGFLRMYWAKKILEWTPSPEEALRIAIYLNDKYQLDGRDPNGYVGCMWSIGGIHDQGWGERPIFGKIRYMNYEGCKRKFDVKKFVAKYPPASRNAMEVSGQRTLKY